MIEFTFSDTLTPRLKAAQRASVDFTPAMAAIADLMRSDAVLAFETETGPDGKRWKASQRAISDGGLTLTDSGNLRQSIVAASDARSAIIGTNLIYAAIHQFGGPVRGRQSSRNQNVPRARVMPARPFLGFSPTTVEAIEDVLGRHITRAFEGGAA